MMMISNMSFGSLPMMNSNIGYGNPQSPLYSNLGMGQEANARVGSANPYSGASAGLNGQVQTQTASTKMPSLRQQSQDAYTSVMNTLSSLQQRSGTGSTSLNSPTSNLTTLGFGSGSNGSAVPTQALNTGNFPQGSGQPVAFGSGTNGSAVPTQALNAGNFPQGSGQPVAFGSGSNGSAVPTSVNNMNSFSQTAQNAYTGLSNTLTSLNSPQGQQRQGQVYSSNPFQIGFDVNGSPLSATDSLNQTLGLATGGNISISTAPGSFGGNTAATANFGVNPQASQGGNSSGMLNGVNLGGQSSVSGSGSSNSLGLNGMNLQTSGNLATMASNGNPSVVTARTGHTSEGVTQPMGETTAQPTGQVYHSSGRTLHIPNASAQTNSPSAGGNCTPSQHSGNATPQAGNQYWPPQESGGHSNGLQTPQVGRPTGGEAGAVATSSQEGGVPFSQIQAFNQRNGAGMPYEVRHEDTGFNYTTVQPQTQANGGHQGSEMMETSASVSSPWHQAWHNAKAFARTGSQQVQGMASNMGGQMTQGLQTMATSAQSFGGNLGNSLGNFFGGFSGFGGGFGGGT